MYSGDRGSEDQGSRSEDVELDVEVRDQGDGWAPQVGRRGLVKDSKTQDPPIIRRRKERGRRRRWLNQKPGLGPRTRSPLVNSWDRLTPHLESSTPVDKSHCDGGWGFGPSSIPLGNLRFNV